MAWTFGIRWEWEMSANAKTDPDLCQILLGGAVLLEHFGHQLGVFLVQQEK